MRYAYEYYKKASDYIREKIGGDVEIGLILGSAMGAIADQIQDKIIIEYKQIPNFLLATVEDHAGLLIAGTLGGKRVICLSGRFHYYEGYDFERLAVPVRVLKLLGVEKLILTNAAGGINEDYSPGDIVLIKDHIKLMRGSPLRGYNIPEFGPRFIDVTDMYTESLREKVKLIAKKRGLALKEGVYYYATGPQFETPAEIKAMRILGGDLVGMSTVTEAITAAHCGIKVLGISLVTNMAAGISGKPISTAEVNQTAKESEVKIIDLVTEVIRQI
ncbi:MAG: purine-nucleoside phosphorylase [Gudongella sp.]|nr:purine-nucleoside phosphorylase [Gudongella sp.]